ncbi:MAG: hypothetical protein Kow00107_05590 [Planctomycetota bacterium]
MRRRWFRFLLFMAFSAMALLVLFWLLSGEGQIVGVLDPGTHSVLMEDSWKFVNLYLVAKLIDQYPLTIIIFVGVVALVNAVTGLMYLTTPAEARNIRYTQGDDEVLVNLDTVAASMQKLLDDEPDIQCARVVLRVPPGKILRINCYVRLELFEQMNIPSRVDVLRERLRTYFEQSLPLEAKFTTSIELKVVQSPTQAPRPEREKSTETGTDRINKDFQGPRFPIDA